MKYDHDIGAIIEGDSSLRFDRGGSEDYVTSIESIVTVFQVTSTLGSEGGDDEWLDRENVHFVYACFCTCDIVVRFSNSYHKDKNKRTDWLSIEFDEGFVNFGIPGNKCFICSYVWQFQKLCNYFANGANEWWRIVMA